MLIKPQVLLSEDLRTAYQTSGASNWSGGKLSYAVGEILSIPRERQADSFVLHAPLELLARSALLPHAEEAARSEAKLRIFSIAWRFENFSAPAYPDRNVVSPTAPPKDAGGDFLEALSNGDLLATDAAYQAMLSTQSMGRIIGSLVDRVIPLTSGAAHAPIFLALFPKIAPRGELPLAMGRQLFREMARHPDWCLTWLDNWEAQSEASPKRITRALQSVSPITKAPAGSIHPTLMSVDQSDVARLALSGALGRWSSDAARAILRVAAHSMLEEDSKHAPYGWSHCLTMPQAVLTLAPFCHDPNRALAIAATHVLAFRHTLRGAASPKAVPEDNPQAREPMELARERLATEVAKRNDAHIAKYVLAALDASAFDPDANALYIRAADHLLKTWDENGPDTDDPLTP